MIRRSRSIRFLAALFPLRYSSDIRSLAFLLFLITLFAAQWSGHLRHWTVLLTTCVFAFVACVIKHNHIHCRTFRTHPWNRAFEYLLGLCTGHPTSAIISIHNERHHGRYHSDEDCVRSSIVRFRSNWLNLICFPFVAISLVHSKKPADLRRWKIEKPDLYHGLIRERFVIAAFIISLLLLDWRATITYVGVPWLFGQWGIVTINLLQHQDCAHDSSHDHSRNITGRFINWLFLNNGFHTAHHLRPALHWSVLPEFHRNEIAPHIRSDLNESSLAVAIWKQFFRGGKASNSTNA